MQRQLADESWVEFDKKGRGHAVVFLHAFPLSNAMWSAQVEWFSDAYKTIAPNARGIGQTPGSLNPFSIEQGAHDLSMLLEELYIAEPITLCGLSMGGYVALAFARLYPQRIGSLILCDTRAEADNEQARAKRDEMVDICLTHTADEIIERQIPSLLGKTTLETRPNVVRRVREIGSSLQPRQLANWVIALRDRPDATEFLPKVHVPTLVVVGEEDTITTPDTALELADQIPNAQLHIVSQAGHLSNLENPKDFNRAVRNFLQEL